MPFKTTSPDLSLSLCSLSLSFSLSLFFSLSMDQFRLHWKFKNSHIIDSHHIQNPDHSINLYVLSILLFVGGLALQSFTFRIGRHGPGAVWAPLFGDVFAHLRGARSFYFHNSVVFILFIFCFSFYEPAKKINIDVFWYVSQFYPRTVPSIGQCAGLLAWNKDPK